MIEGEKLSEFKEIELKLPLKNSEGAPAFELTEEQKYLFDTRGWALFPGVLKESELAEMRDFCYRLQKDSKSLEPKDRSSIGGPLLSLIDHPAILGFMNEFVADPHAWSENGYGFRLENSFLTIRREGDTNFSPHGGSGILSHGYNSHLYRQSHGSVYSGLTRAVWELNPVKRGCGGTKFLTGSHKAAFDAPASSQNEDSPLWEDYECPAGSLLFFTEAITHTGSKWTDSEFDRIAIFNCYNSIGSRWHQWQPSPEALDSMSPLRRSLFRAVCCQDNQV